ncbi:hypothetical protein [Streptomyces sp. NPDC008121]|uniref:hypothetical protein n=1 Tax=Streptomyces sp. NPDC008121 TaxID=3364809 RepID=UPI0036EF4BA4
MSGLAGKRGWRRVALAVMAMAAAGPLALPASPVWAAGEAAEQQVGAAAAGIAVDESARLPALKTNEVTGDFLGLGHDQRAVLEEAVTGLNGSSVKLRIYDGKGDKLKETTLSLGEWKPPRGVLADPWAHHGWADRAGLTGTKISAGKDGNLYVAGILGKVPDFYAAALVKIDTRHDMRQVDTKVVPLVRIDGDINRAPIVTSLDVGVVNGVETLAVGQSAGGVRLYSTSDLGFQGAVYEDWKRWSYMTWGRDLVTAVKFSGEGSVKTPEGNKVTGLAIGRLAYDYEDYSTHSLYMVDPAAKKGLWQQVESAHFDSGEIKAPTAFAFDDENQRLAVSWWHEKQKDGRLESLQIRDTSSGQELLHSAPIGPAARLSFVKVGSNGELHLVVGSRETDTNQVLVHRSGDLLEAIDLLSSGRASKTVPDFEMRSWFPGYKSLRLSVVNTTGKKLEARLKASDSGDKGCWSNIQVGQLPPFPSSSFTPIRASEKSADFASVVLTSGPAGACGTEERRFGYIEVQPVGEPGMRSVVKLKQQGSQLGAVEQVGSGVLKITAENLGDIGSGQQQLVVSLAAGAPEAVRAPQVAGKRLTTTSPDGDPARPVYRFDVTDAAWKVPGADNDLTGTQLPAMTVQGTTNGLVWEDLGKLKPVTAPALTGDTVTLGKSSFYWENVKDARQYTGIRVQSGGMVSQPVVLRDLPAPSLGTEELTLSFLRPITESPLRANGIDQEPVEVALKPRTSPALDASRPEYDRVFYRGEGKMLLTGLLDVDNPYSHAAISSLPGPYVNEDDFLMSASGSERFRAYLTTANAARDQKFTAYFQNTEGKPFAFSSTIAVSPRAAKLRPVPVPGGIGVEVEKQSPTDSCKEGACRIADTRVGPALFQSHEATAIGISLRTQVITGTSSLPLLAPGVDLGRFPSGEPLKKSSIAVINRNTAEVESKNEWSSKIHGIMVSHGDQIEIVDFSAQ